MLTNEGCDTLKRFLEQEAAYKPKKYCEECQKRERQKCDALKSRYSEEDKIIFQRVWDNVHIIEKDGEKRIMAEYIYCNPVGKTFKPENSNTKEARARTNRLIDKLMKKGQLDLLQDEIQKKIDIGTQRELRVEDKDDQRNYDEQQGRNWFQHREPSPIQRHRKQ